ncbi:alpha/beta fold hydrolase [Serratia marcescens]|uniref:alpha/beta fold hydrolase n=1 Tax=Serratia marcescens TaxID=615 RepID=UPI000B61A992|nr:alpha/beta hydrolase [Serratia marcescens]ASM12226.1 alpha/beta hydrolase [Serratia marcescens]
MHYQQKISASYRDADSAEFRGDLTLKLVRNLIKVGEVISPGYTKGKMESLIFRPKKKKHDPKDSFLETAESTEIFSLTSGIRCRYYLWGGAKPDVLLVHGWESRASHFAKLIDILVAKGFCVAAFDAVAHGRSDGVEADMLDFIECISRLHELFGGIDSIIGYSFGGISAINAVKAGLSVNRLGVISSPSSFYGIFEKLSMQLQLSKSMHEHLAEVITRRYRIDTDGWDHYSTYHGVAEQRVPLVAIHDANDSYVHKIESDILVDAWPNATLIETQGLGHRRIITSEAAMQVFCDALLK